ncbi:hypothetical protein KCP76_03400 [Salmonella enterica subsp. enterica serovar Weltevreden]|nr:hypothetical protein KCP76_03400 [Salmonella enterica subsp. enterica serovar Weltevreden]
MTVAASLASAGARRKRAYAVREHCQLANAPALGGRAPCFVEHLRRQNGK